MLWFENIHETYLFSHWTETLFDEKTKVVYISYMYLKLQCFWKQLYIYILIYISHKYIYIYINGIDDGSNNNSDKTMVITVLVMTITVFVMIIPVLVMIVTVLL